MVSRPRLQLEVIDVTREATEVIAVTLRDPEGKALPAWEPGAHIEIELPSGLSRQYSLCGDPADRERYTIAVLREPEGKGGSIELHELARRGVTLDVGVPKNDFVLYDAPAYLFLAGGIGITPVIPMVAQAEARGVPWSLAYGGRAKETMAFCSTLERYGERVELWVESERGYPDLASLLKAAPEGTLVYTCGPAAMIEAVPQEHARHDHLGALHFERFEAAGPIDRSGVGFEVYLEQSHVTLTVLEGQSILETVRTVLPDQPFSCEEGYCGECETAVLEGEPDHRDDFLTPDEQDSGETMMICVSRCKGARLVLDL